MSIIAAQRVTKRFGAVTAVDEVSFTVDRGELFAFLGPNGAGKSTTIKMLTTLLQPTSGRLSLAGHDPTVEAEAARSTFGIVFQESSLDGELTAYENMEVHAVLHHVRLSERRPRIEELLQFVELWDRRDGLVKTFSGGMKRRLEIARGLLHHPTILFLDEPTLGLDTQTRTRMWGYLKDLNAREGTTIFCGRAWV
jgi:ABC-2 type transport system ATP-binding protein